MQARFYAPWYGRFLSPDPGLDQHFEFTQKWNIYSYVSNNPTMNFDPDGMQESSGVERMIAYNNKKHGPAYASGDPKRIASAQAEMEEQRTGTMVVASIALGARFLGGVGIRATLALAGKLAQNEAQRPGSTASALQGIKQEVQAAPQQAQAAKTAFDVAEAGGKHAGFLKNYMDKPLEQLQKGISTIQGRISEHQDKIQNPSKYIEDFSKLDPRQQQALINQKWPSDIARQKEQLQILQELAKRKQ